MRVVVGHPPLILTYPELNLFRRSFERQQGLTRLHTLELLRCGQIMQGDTWASRYLVSATQDDVVHGGTRSAGRPVQLAHSLTGIACYGEEDFVFLLCAWATAPWLFRSGRVALFEAAMPQSHRLHRGCLLP